MIPSALTAAVRLPGRRTSATGRGNHRRCILVLRTNPKDSSLAKTLGVLSSAFDLHCLVWDRAGDVELPDGHTGTRVVACHAKGGYYSVSAIVGMLRLQPWFLFRGLRRRPDAVHAMDLDTGVIGLLLARLLRVPFVYHCLDPYYAALPASWPRFLGTLARIVEDKVISGADMFVITDVRRLPQHPGARPKTLVEFANVPYSNVVPTFAEEPHTDGTTVGYVGSLVPHRNLACLIQAVRELEEEGFRLVIGGYGPLSAEIEALCRGADNVDFLGWVPTDRLGALQETFDVFIQVEDPSHAAYRWVSPNKLFDSMAYGRPIVVAEGTLAAERALEVGHGVTVPYGNLPALKARLQELRSDRAKSVQMGRAGRNAYERDWSPHIMRERLLSAYARVVESQ